MPAFRFVGSHAKILDTPYTFSRFGQAVELTEELARQAVLARVRLVPAAVWSGLGITEQDLQKQDSEIETKKRLAWAAAEDYHASLLDPPQTPQTDPPSEPVTEHIAEE
jgi:hypothetical protein